MFSDRLSRKRPLETCKGENASSSDSERSGKLRRLRHEHGLRTDGSAPLGHRGDDETSREASDKTSSGGHELQESTGSGGNVADVGTEVLSSQFPRRRRTERNINLNVSDQEKTAKWHQHIQQLNELPFLQSENPTEDHPEEMVKPSKSEGLEKVKEALGILKPFIKEHPELGTLQEKIDALRFQLGKEHLTTNGAPKTYQQILKFIAHAPLPDDTRTQIETLLKETMEKFRVLNDPPQRDHGERESSRYAEQGHTDAEAIERITQSFLEAAERPKLPKGQRYPPLGISLSNAQYNEVVRHLRDNKEIPALIFKKARNRAYQASDKGKEVAKIYNASDKGKAAIKRHKTSDKGREAIKIYNASDKGKAVIKKYNASDKRKAAIKR
jgi:hypothetical protein